VVFVVVTAPPPALVLADLTCLVSSVVKRYLPYIENGRSIKGGSTVRSKIRKRIGVLLVTAAASMAAMAVMPAAGAQAAYCASAYSCQSESIWLNSGLVDIYFDGWDNRQYLVKLYVAGREKCHFWRWGHDPPAIYACYRVGTGHTYAISWSDQLLAAHSIRVREYWD
jgi:hypothetical protein